MILGKDLRLFRRLITAFRLLNNSFLISRVLKEVKKNPDNKLMVNAVRYFKCFPNRKTISDKLIDFLYSPLNQFDQQEAYILNVLRYVRTYPKRLFSYVKTIKKTKCWYVRIQAILLIDQLELSKRELNLLLKQYYSEKNIEIKRSFIKPLCQLGENDLNKFLKEAVFERNSRITQVIKMLLLLQDKKTEAFNEINYIFNDFREDKLMDEFYKLEIIKFSNNDEARKVLLKSLKRKQLKIHRPILLKKVKRIIRFLEEAKK